MVGGLGGGLPDPSLRGLLPPLTRRQETLFSQSSLDRVWGCEKGLSYGGEPLCSSRATPAHAATNGAQGTPPPTIRRRGAGRATSPLVAV